MERYKKKDMLQTVDMLIRANDAVTRTAVSNPQGAGEALVQCQESAIVLGTYIDTLGEEYALLVRTLEDYCENIYQMSENLADANLCRKISKKIQKQLTSLYNGIKYDMPEDRKEVVFLPYKASMWDSLESVWKAADADENTDAYVIPIPYFDKNPDGTFSKEHYEGDLYPGYVPITRYDAYDFENRRPDMIYIHNPYDECNHVTSVHPYFYSKNLRNFTDKLVYIPYFILKEIEPDNQEEIDRMKHFCFMPGIIYADQVIVQSEKMRQIYINEYIKAAKEYGLSGEHTDRAFLEKKILGLGSPKLDKVLNTKKEDLEVPDEWLKIIEKPNGSYKKIIFYNTSISALLKYNEKMLRKMESVFQVFKENQDEVALWWRPHPLIESTLTSMRPQLWDGYREIRDKYVEEGWGIYDDTADLDRAVVVSDAYYGDGSSVVELYKKMGKPLMMQTISISMAMYNIVEYEGEWWFFAFEDSSIYRMDKRTFETNMVVRVPWDIEHNECMPQYGKIHICNRKIFVLPWHVNRIVIYDMDEENIRYIEYDQQVNRGEVFWDSVEWENNLYLIPCSYEHILKINLITEKISFILLESERCLPEDKKNYAWGSFFIDKSKLYFTKLFDNKILQVDLKNGNQQVYECNYLEKGGAGICGDEVSIWIIPQKAERILCWDREQKKLNIYVDFPDEFEAGEWSFSKVRLCGTHLYLLPRDANMCIAVNRWDGKMSCLSLGTVGIDSGDFYDKYLRFSELWCDCGKVYIVNTRRGDIYCIDDDTLEIVAVQEKKLLSYGGSNIETDFILSGI